MTDEIIIDGVDVTITDEDGKEYKLENCEVTKYNPSDKDKDLLKNIAEEIDENNHNDAFDNIAEIFDCDREFVENMAEVAFGDLEDRDDMGDNDE